MNIKKVRIEWRTQILGIAFLALISCGPVQKENKQTGKIPAAQQPQAEPVPIEQDATNMEESTEERATIVLNPPHGEPGHLCEIPVGSPLPTNASTAESNNSQSAPAAAEATKRYNSMAPTVENARRLKATQGSQAQPPPTGKKPELNPPHGQPWHRCDVNVGSPLP